MNLFYQYILVFNFYFFFDILLNVNYQIDNYCRVVLKYIYIIINFVFNKTHFIDKYELIRGIDNKTSFFHLF